MMRGEEEEEGWMGAVAAGRRPLHNGHRHSAIPPHVLFFFLSVIMIIGVCARNFLRFSKTPYTVVVLIIGMLIGVMFENAKLKLFGTSLKEWVEIDPDLIYYGIIPGLVFEGAFAMDFHLVKRTFTQAYILAFLGVIVCAILTAVYVKYCFPASYEWTWDICLLFGAILGATDTVAVVNILKESGATMALIAVIDGEALLNDGSAVVVYQVFRQRVYAEVSTDARMPSITDNVVSFFRLSLGGIVFGVVCGLISQFFVTMSYSNPVSKSVLSLAVTYLTFFIAEQILGVSGILTVLHVGLVWGYLARPTFDKHEEATVTEFWHIVAHILNTLLFTLVGLIVVVKSYYGSEYKGYDWGYMVSLYVMVNLFRLGMVLLTWPVLRKLGYGLSFKDMLVVSLAGLRGAMSVILALVIQQTSSMPASVRELFLFHIGGVSLLTLIINANLARPIIKYLGIVPESEAKVHNFITVISAIDEDTERVKNNLRSQQFFRGADWAEIDKHLQEVRVSRMTLLAKARDLQLENPETLLAAATAATTSSSTMTAAAAAATTTATTIATTATTATTVATTISPSSSTTAMMEAHEAGGDATVGNYLGVRVHQQQRTQPWTSFFRAVSKFFAQFRHGGEVVPWTELRATSAKKVSPVGSANLMRAFVTGLLVDARERYFNRLKHLYFTLREEKIITVRAYLALLDSVNHALDRKWEAGQEWPYLEKTYCEIPSYFYELRHQKFADLLLNYVCFRQIRRSCSIVSGYIQASHTLCNLLATFGPPVVVEALKAELDKHRLGAIAFLESVESSFPEVALQVKTIEATRSILNQETEHIANLFNCGQIDKSESEFLSVSVAKTLFKMNFIPRFSRLRTLPEVLVKDCLVFAGVDVPMSRLLKIGKFYNYRANQAIVRIGSMCKLVVVVKGTVRETFTASNNFVGQDTSPDPYRRVGDTIGLFPFMLAEPSISEAVAISNVVVTFEIECIHKRQFFEFSPLIPTNCWRICGRDAAEARGWSEEARLCMTADVFTGDGHCKMNSCHALVLVGAIVHENRQETRAVALTSPDENNYFWIAKKNSKVLIFDKKLSLARSATTYAIAGFGAEQ